MEYKGSSDMHKCIDGQIHAGYLNEDDLNALKNETTIELSDGRHKMTIGPPSYCDGYALVYGDDAFTIGVIYDGYTKLYGYNNDDTYYFNFLYDTFYVISMEGKRIASIDCDMLTEIGSFTFFHPNDTDMLSVRHKNRMLSWEMIVYGNGAITLPGIHLDGDLLEARNNWVAK